MNKIEVIRSRRRSIALEVKEDGRVLVRAPLWTSRRDLEQFVDRHGTWIARQLQRLEREKESRAGAVRLSEEELKALVRSARKQILSRLEHFAPLVGTDYGRVSIRKQRTKWGSCSSEGNLNFNCLLMLAPPQVLDYVVVHELCHRLEMDHSRRFWAQVARVLPDYAQSRRWLKENGAGLMARLPEK